MRNPRDYPEIIQSAETGRPLRRGVKLLTINVDGQPFTYGQPGWWASLDDPGDAEGQLTDDDNKIRAAARREARASVKQSILTPLVIKAIREACGLSQQEAAHVFGGGPKAFEKYETGEVAPSSSMTRLLLLAARRPEFFQKGAGVPLISEAHSIIREIVRHSSINRIYEQIYNLNSKIILEQYDPAEATNSTSKKGSPRTQGSKKRSQNSVLQREAAMVQKTAFQLSEFQQPDLALAWRRTKADLQSERVFVRAPYEIELVDEDLENWLLQLKQKIQSGYRPSSTTIADVPKGNGAIRPGAILSLEDRTVYAGIVGALLPTIYVGLKWEQGTVDFAYQLSEQTDRVNWFTNRYTGWTDFRNAQLQKLADEEITHVVVSDLTGFYENIDLTILMSDLRALGCDPDVVQLLQTCLYRWALLPGRGIPQGYSASDVLAKVYLNPIDQAIIDEGFDYIRYVDDMRVFCKGFADCKRALLFAIQAFRRRGLNLQTSKTEMIVRDHAKVRIEGISPLIAAVQERYRKDISQIIGSVDPYAPISEIEAQVNPDEAPLEVLKEVFNEYFTGEEARFNSTLFHYLLNRFGAQKDASMMKFGMRQLYIRPQETQPVLDYISAVGAHDEAYPEVLRFLKSQDDLYEYQKYQIFRWIAEATVTPTPGLLTLARQLTFDLSRPAYLRAVCRKLLQDHGTIADLDRLEASYVDVRDDLEAAQTLISLKRMDAGRRNAFYGRVEDDGVLRARAVRLVRQGRV